MEEFAKQIAIVVGVLVACFIEPVVAIGLLVLRKRRARARRRSPIGIDLLRGPVPLQMPGIDHLFDRGFIAFEDTGQVIVSPVAHRESLLRMGIKPENPPKVGTFSTGQRRFLQFHRDNVLLRSGFLEHL